MPSDTNSTRPDSHRNYVPSMADHARSVQCPLRIYDPDDLILEQDLQETAVRRLRELRRRVLAEMGLS